MILTRVQVGNFQSFGNTQIFKPHKRLAMLVGPNEAGKTSLLDAIAVLGDRIRPEQIRHNISAGDCSIAISLDFEERDVAAGTDLNHKLESVEITYSGDASATTWSFRPALPKRNFDDEIIQSAWKEALTEMEIVQRRPNFERLENTFRDTYNNVSPDRKPAVQGLNQCVQGLDYDDLPKTTEFRNLLLSETAFEIAVDFTEGVLPRVLNFDSTHRDIKASYTVVEPDQHPNRSNENRQPLNNILELAELDLAGLPDLQGKIDLELRRANSCLESKFKRLWGPNKPFPQLRIDARRIHIWVLDPEHDEQSGLSVDRRSAGVLRMIEIIAFSANANKNESRTVILADEIEQHLHYDAQVELIEWLEQGSLHAQVIASTHSIGCWPADIGAQMNAIERVAGASLVHNGPYSRLAPGQDGLMAAIGASRVAVRVRGPVVFCEGPIDEMLMPTLFHESGCDVSGVAFVGSLSQSKPGFPPSYPSVPLEAFIFDSDDGGEELKKHLKSADPARSTRCHLLGENGPTKLVTVEDLLDQQLLLDLSLIHI